MHYQSNLSKKAIANAMAFLFFALMVTFFLMSPALANETQNKPSPPEGQNTLEFKATLYLALEGESAQPTNKSKIHFDCSDKIYAVLELNNASRGKHSLSFRWNGPNNEELERVDYPFTVSNDKTRLWAWLNLIRSRGAGMISWINPAAGLEEFIGPWTIDAYIDKKKIASNSFSVDC
jgi:hypothetical protein